jgi:hypothetical protein
MIFIENTMVRTAKSAGYLGNAGESLALMEDDLEEQRLTLLHDSKDRLPAYFIVTLPGPQRAASRAFLKWLEQAA